MLNCDFIDAHVAPTRVKIEPTANPLAALAQEGKKAALVLILHRLTSVWSGLVRSSLS